MVYKSENDAMVVIENTLSTVNCESEVNFFSDSVQSNTIMRVAIFKVVATRKESSEIADTLVRLNHTDTDIRYNGSKTTATADGGELRIFFLEAKINAGA